MTEYVEVDNSLSATLATVGMFVVESQPVIGIGQTTADNRPREMRATTMMGHETIAYLRAEFPSECWYFPRVATTITHSLQQFFVNLLPKDPRIEHVFWFSEEETLKVWTVIPEPDFSLERPLYEAQASFMEAFPEYECDFSVIYRFGKAISDISPHGAYVVF
jgi:hypothetical protein